MRLCVIVTSPHVDDDGVTVITRDVLGECGVDEGLQLRAGELRTETLIPRRLVPDTPIVKTHLISRNREPPKAGERVKPHVHPGCFEHPPGVPSG